MVKLIVQRRRLITTLRPSHRAADAPLPHLTTASLEAPRTSSFYLVHRAQVAGKNNKATQKAKTTIGRDRASLRTRLRYSKDVGIIRLGILKNYH